jgi:hypothetical protein
MKKYIALQVLFPLVFCYSCATACASDRNELRKKTAEAELGLKFSENIKKPT